MSLYGSVSNGVVHCSSCSMLWRLVRIDSTSSSSESLCSVTISTSSSSDEEEASISGGSTGGRFGLGPDRSRSWFWPRWTWSAVGVMRS